MDKSQTTSPVSGKPSPDRPRQFYGLTNASGEFVPRPRDAALIEVPPEPSFLDFFKQSLIYTSPYCTTPGCCSFFDDTPAVSTDDQTQAQPEVAYPLSLLTDLDQLPPMSVLRDLSQLFRAKVLHAMPFLSEVTCMALESKDMPFYVVLSQALFGAVLSEDRQYETLVNDMWQAASSLITVNIEVDNSLGRTIPWHVASSLIITYGVMQSDGRIWSSLETINGVLQWTLIRDGLMTRPNTVGSAIRGFQGPVEQDAAHLRKFYFMIDTIRSMHIPVPSMVDRTLSIRVGGQAEFDLHELCDSLVMEQRPLPPGLTNDDHLLVLLSLLSHVHRLFCAMGRLTKSYLLICEQMELLGGRNYNGTATNDTDVEYSHLVPFTAEHEYSRMKTKLKAALDGWHTSFESRQIRLPSQAGYSEQSILVLYDFARLLLATGPTVYLLPSLAGYAPEGFDQAPSGLKRPCAPHIAGVDFSESALHIAMRLLEDVELGNAAQTASARGSQLQCVPPWYPLALFYSALITWSRMRKDVATPLPSSPSPRTLLTPFKLLQMLYLELYKMQNHWDCSRSMAAVVSSLIADHSDE